MTMISENRDQKGFSIVELCIVLTVIAFLIGSVIVGQSLVETSKLRSVTVEVKNFQSAVSQFEDKYGGLPGDLPDAASYFGCVSCNGDGNERIVWNNEGPDAWFHLQAANMIEPYGFTAGSANGTLASIGVNVPDSDVENAGYAIDTGLKAYPCTLCSAEYTLTDNYFAFGGVGATGLNMPVLTPKQASLIDTKIDDGYVSGALLEVKGTIIGAGGVDRANCSVVDGIEYDTEQEDPTCMLYIRVSNKISLRK